MTSNCSGVMMVRGLATAAGVLTPWPGCRKVTWSLSAVVKIASKDGLAVLDRCCSHVLPFQAGDEVADVRWQDVDHAHGAELGEDPGVELIPIVLPRPPLKPVVWKPLVLDIALEGLTAAPRVADPSFPDPHLCLLPGLVGVLLVRERSRRSLLASKVEVSGRRSESCRLHLCARA